MLDTPKAVLELTGHERECELLAKRYDSLMLLRYRRASPSQHAYCEAADYISKISGIALSQAETQEILDLYPKARIPLAIFGGVGAQRVRNALSSAIADFFLGGLWLDKDAGRDSELFIDLIQSQARVMGYGVQRDSSVAQNCEPSPPFA